MATHQGNAYRSGMATGMAKPGDTFQKPAPVMQAPGATTSGDAGKENATASRAAAAPASTSEPEKQEEKRWQVRVDLIPAKQRAPTTHSRVRRASTARGIPPLRRKRIHKTKIGGVHSALYTSLS